MHTATLDSRRFFLSAFIWFSLLVYFCVCVSVAYSNSTWMPLLSFYIFFVFVSVWAGILKFDISNSFFFFSAMLMGYSLGGLYYSMSDGYYGKFLEFYHLHDQDIVDYMFFSMSYVAVFYTFFSVFYSLKRYEEIGRSDFVFESSELSRFASKNFFSIYFILALFVLAYWVYVSIVIAGDIYSAVIYFQMFPHFVAEAGVSIAPYLIFYSVVYLWAVHTVQENKPVGAVFLLFVLLGLIMIFSTGRIAQAICFVFAIAVFLLMARPRYYKNIILIFICLFALGLAVHFAREMSNLLFLRVDHDEVEFDFLKIIVGGGNVADLQQLVIVFDFFSDREFLYGNTYLDWFRNSIGQYFGLQISSVGLIIHSEIIPNDSSSGAPTPGALGELWANFGIFSIIISALLGVSLRVVDDFCNKSKSIFVKLVYSVFLTHFVFLFAKVDSTMLVNFLWAVTPVFLITFFPFVLYKVWGLFLNLSRSEGVCFSEVE